MRWSLRPNAQNSRSASARSSIDQVPQVEEAERLLHLVGGVVVVLEEVLLVQVAVVGEQVADRFRGIVGERVRRGAVVEVRGAEHVEDEHRVVRDHRPPALGDDRRVRHARLVAHLLDAVDDVVGVLLQRVVGARLESGLRAVVVDAQAAADVDVLEARAEPVELDVHAAPPRSARPSPCGCRRPASPCGSGSSAGSRPGRGP